MAVIVFDWSWLEMLAKERQEKIYNMIKTNGAVYTSSLVGSFGVSIETIRKDLLAMETSGLLTRVHGGAIHSGNLKPYLPLEERNHDYEKEKISLTKKAIGFISEGDIISVDAGSTAIIFAEQLAAHFKNLTVVTHSLDVLNILKRNEGITVILCGGEFICDENAFSGTVTISDIDRLYVNKAFIFPSAVSIEGGICDYHRDLTMVQAHLIHSAGDVFILADSSKLEKRAFIHISDMSSDFSYITDGTAPEEIIAIYRENGYKIYQGE